MNRSNPYHKKAKRSTVPRYSSSSSSSSQGNGTAPTAPLNTTQFLISNFEELYEVNPASSVFSYQRPSDSSLETDLNTFGSMSSLMTMQRTAACRS
jgi:hypothetical protein